ncbi:hypothetical protein CAP36_06395 [Chitinophagaceae bacterium IBVUCB2]|nr:hypothetical protein CAP36_06395 [Chitinophagaceae bacterium IBVUCB2]
MNWFQIVFLVLAILVIVVNIQALMSYKRSKMPEDSRKFPIRKWSMIFSSLLAAWVIYSAIKSWIE